MPLANKHPEAGVVMLITLTILVMAGLSFALDALLIKSTRVREDIRASQTLSQAKEALMAYAAVYNRTNAAVRLPCPYLGNIGDYDTGGSEGNCNGSSTDAFGL
ncbi:MAG: hypothetical protein HQL66_15625, partial [Magnetococcales bacterium]|nr:hypothetical protein [Magnetococcales bacterium]